MINWNEQERVRQLLTEAVTVLCKNGLKYSSKFCVEGLLGITLDDNDILLVNIKETIGTGGASGISMAPVQVKSPPMMSRSPMGMGHRMAMTSPRRGRAKPVMSRGRGGFGFNRKRALFSSPMKNTASPMRPIGSPPQQQLAMPLPDQSGLTEGPSPKMKREEEPAGSADDDVIEIGDEDDAATAHTTQPDDEATIKQEIQDQPSSSTDPQQQQQQDSKFTLDNETNKSLTDFLDNLMTQHDVGPNSSSNQAARGGAPLSQMSQISPKAEPMNMPWEHSQPVGYSSPPGHSAAPQFHSPSQQSQAVATWESMGRSLHLEALSRINLPLLSASSCNPTTAAAAVGLSSQSILQQVSQQTVMSLLPPGSQLSMTQSGQLPTVAAAAVSPESVSVPQALPPVESQPETNPVTPTKIRRKQEVAASPKHKDSVAASPFKNKGYVNVTMAFNCTICNRTFTTQTALQNHIYAHHEDSQNKEFQCGLCSKRFLHKSSMMRHEAMHRGRHSCLQCQRTFPKKEDLDTHVKVIHMGVKEFSCQICNSSFGYKRNLVIHMKNVHPKNG